MSEETALDVKTTPDPALYRAIFRASPALLFLTDMRAVIVDATAEAAAFLNVSIEFLEHKPLLHFVARGDTKRFRSFVRQAVWEPIDVKLRPRHQAPRETTLAILPAAGQLVWRVEVHAPRESVPPVVEDSRAPEALSHAAGGESIGAA